MSVFFVLMMIIMIEIMFSWGAAYLIKTFISTARFGIYLADCLLSYVLDLLAQFATAPFQPSC